jgi:hypothetical protein
MRANALEAIGKDLKIKRKTWREGSVSPALGKAEPETGDDGVGVGELTESTLLPLATETVLSP